MTTAIQSLTEIADGYDAIVLDQWGVLHNGSTPYPGVADALKSITAAGHRLAILSNSGKRADPNADRIRQMGFASGLFTTVMTAGEALWHDVKTGSVPHRSFHVIESRQGDATRWAEGLDIGMGCDIRTADAVLLMGLPDDTTLMPWQPVLDAAGDRNLTVYCSNPDHIAPRAGGRTVLSPGALAREYEQLGGDVVYYGKPHPQVFITLADVMQAAPEDLLMVGDSPDHDIRGANAVGWDSVLVFGGLLQDMLTHDDPVHSLVALCNDRNLPLPDYTIELLR